MMEIHGIRLIVLAFSVIYVEGSIRSGLYWKLVNRIYQLTS